MKKSVRNVSLIAAAVVVLGAVYFLGGLTWYHAKLGILMSLQKLSDAGVVTL